MHSQADLDFLPEVKVLCTLESSGVSCSLPWPSDPVQGLQILHGRVMKGNEDERDGKQKSQATARSTFLKLRRTVKT